MCFHGIAVAFPRAHGVTPSTLGAFRAVGEAAVLALTGVALALAMLAVGPRVLPYRILPVLTGSMEPEIPTGALAVVMPVSAADVVVGNVITFHHPLRADAYVTHRVVAILEDASGRTFVTRGDANVSPDPWRISGAGGGWRLVFAVPQLGRALNVLGSTPLRTLAEMSLVALAVLALRRIWRPGPAGAPVPLTARAA